MIAATRDLPADALAYYADATFVIILNATLPLNVRGWLADHLLALVDRSAPELTLRIPRGEAVRMFNAPNAEI